MAFPESFLDELISKNDIVDVVGSYVRLMKKSGSNLFGLCPFHSEKTPSFSVSPDKQIYHCFGCGKGGGVVNFVMEIENLSYVDAVHVLAQRSGMVVPDLKSSKETQSKRARLLELNRDAARFFYSVLQTPQGTAARAYIEKRDISKAMVTRFGLGAAPDDWTALSIAMHKLGYTRQELLDAGLVKLSRRDEKSVYDTFRNRLMFPVIDVRGSVVGFSGRILNDGEPKYLNSPDTLVFDKSRNLFAINLAKKTKSDMLILAEGNIDVVALHQAGFDGAVASLGTSLTEDQVRLMSRYTQNVAVAYDGDTAGIKAAQRALGLLEKAGLNVRVLRLQGAKDPDEFIQKFGRDAFSVLIERSENHIDYRLTLIREKHDLSSDAGRLDYLAEATTMLSRIDNAVEREIYGAKVAETAGVSSEAVKNEVKKAFKKRLSAEKKRKDRAEQNVENVRQPTDRAIRYENVYSATAEEGVVRLAVLDSAMCDVADKLDFTEADFSSPFLADVFAIIRKRRQAGLDVTTAALLAELGSSEASQLSVILQRPESLANANKAMRDYIDKIRTEQKKRTAKEDPLLVLASYRDKSGCGGK
ncbi:DNA primase [Oscillospiraceae bacterium CM]|nr:DNA primase [Oscillospiraceae bacterium CM]